MARFEITGPDGSRFEITAPDDATEEQIMQFAQQQFSAMRKEPEMTTGEVAADVAKSAGIGAAQGVMGLAMLPGNLEALGRAGINYGASAMGYEQPVVDPDTALPNYNDAKKVAEHYLGKFYEPKTTAGQYARTVGEFLPAGLGGGGLAARAARVAVPAVASETAGQLTAGTSMEPWARAGGAIAGGMAPNLPARLVTPNPQTAERARQVANLEQQGVTSLTAGQRTGSQRIRSLEDASQLIPFGGARARTMQNEAERQFTRAVLRQAGVNADEATGPVLTQAFADIGQEYQNIARVVDLRPSPAFVSRLRNIVQRYNDNTPATERMPRIEGLLDDLSQRQSLSGQQYVNFVSTLKSAERSIRKDKTVDRQALRDIIRTIEAQAVRSAPAPIRNQLRNEMRDLNRRYRTLAIVEDAVAKAPGEASASGIISPAQLKRAISKRNPREYTRESSQIGQLAKAGEGVMRPLPSSGTAERSFAQSLLNPAATLTAGGGVGYAVAPEAALAGMLLGGAVPAGISRGLMSRPVQAYLANQAVPGQIPRNLYGSALAPYLLNKEDQK